jgi:hypothetical protein
VFSVVDACTRQCLALEADTSFASRRVTGVLERAMSEYGGRGRPSRLPSGAFGGLDCRPLPRKTFTWISSEGKL